MGADLAALRREVGRLRHRLARAEDKAANLRLALTSNRRIGIAVGILMASQHLTEAQAFAALRQMSNRENLKVREVAERVIYTGQV